MNFVFISPYFPLNYYQFCLALKRAGVNVLAIGDMPYDNLRHDLKESLTEYYWVHDLHDRNALKAACDHFIAKHGPIDRLESHNEYWLQTDAWLRGEYGIYGLKTDEIVKRQSKNSMKDIFIKAGVAVAAGEIVKDKQEALKFIKKVDYPVIIKPDVGVGASNTQRINNDKELEEFFCQSDGNRYIMEEFVVGQIHTFDGLTDAEGNIVFSNSLVYRHGIMELARDGLDVEFYSEQQIPADLEEAGRNSVAAFELKERFFHIEYFRRKKDNKIIALEANLRPPGGPILDMMNYANDINIYQEWANMIVTGKFDTTIYDSEKRKYFCDYIGRRYHHDYMFSHDEIMAKFGEYIVANEELPPLYREAMGDYCYIIRSPHWKVVAEVQAAILERK